MDFTQIMLSLVGVLIGFGLTSLISYLHWRKHRNDPPRWSNLRWINKPPGYD